MTVTPLHRDSRWAGWESDHQDQLMERRAALLIALDDAQGLLARAAEVLDELRAPAMLDGELSYGRDGRDAAALIDVATREARAAFAVLQMRFAGEGPRR